MQQRYRNCLKAGIVICGLSVGVTPLAAQQTDNTDVNALVQPVPATLVPSTLGDEPLRLDPPKTKPGATASRRSWQDTIPRTSGQVGVVLGIFAGLMVLWRLSKGRDSALPADLVEVYGKVPMSGKQSLHLVRIGGRLLILIESSQGMQRLAEISDPDEVRSVVDQLGKGHVRRLPPSLQNLVNDRHLSSFRTG